MKNVALVVVALGLLACNSPRPNLVDSGTVVPDTGMAGHDSGTVAHADTGTAGGTCGSIAGSTDVWPALPAGCLPRCTTATMTAYNACAAMTDMAARASCITAAFAADHTATVTVATSATASVPVSCGGDTTTTFGCIEWQQLAAESTVCGPSLMAFITCANGVPTGGNVQTTCASEITARNNCITSNMAAFQASYNMLGSMCFG